MNSNVESWDITSIHCTHWGEASSTAEVRASNWANDEMNFEIAIHPDQFIVFYNLEIDFRSDGLMAYQANDIIQLQLINQAEVILNQWWQEISSLLKFMNRKDWEVPRGLAVEEIQYARLAQLYSLRARHSALNVTQLLATDMSVPISTARERVRKAREKGFLTSPGKGLNGQGEITKKAIQLIRKEDIK